MKSSKKKIRVCVVIPAYNEEPAIGAVVSSAREAFRRSKYETTVLVVDDGSQDRTANEAARHGATVIKHILNSGAGSATSTGLSYAQQNDFDIAVTMDADGQHAPEDAVEGVNQSLIRGTDLMIGSRLIDSDGMSRVKILGNKGLSLITYLIFGINSTDSQSGLRVFSKKALGKLKWRTNGYEFCSEMLWRAKQIGLTIEEYPIKAIYSEYSKAKGQNNWNAINIIKSLVARRISELFG